MERSRTLFTSHLLSSRRPQQNYSRLLHPQPCHFISVRSRAQRPQNKRSNPCETFFQRACADSDPSGKIPSKMSLPRAPREGPGRRSCVASLNARAASTPAQAGVALKSPPSRAKSSTSADLLQTHDGRQLSQDKTRPSVAKSEAGAVTDTSSSNPPVPTPLRTNASLAGRAVTFKDMTMAAGTSAPSTAPVQPPLLSAQSSSTAAKQAFKSVRNLLPKGMRRQRSFWQDSFEDESSKGTREGPGVEVASPASTQEQHQHQHRQGCLEITAVAQAITERSHDVGT